MRETSQRWAFGALAFAYAAVVLSLISFASTPVALPPFAIGIYGVAICLADFCTALFLIRQYRHEGQPYLLALTSAYWLGACLVVPMALSFPDAFGRGQINGHGTTSAILFLAWRIGATGMLLAGVVLGLRAVPPASMSTRAPNMIATVLGTTMVAGVILFSAHHWQIAPLAQGRFNSSSFAGGWLVIAMSLAGVIIIFTTRSQSRPMFGWLALMLTATMADMTLSTLAGARYTLGWYAARCSMVVSSYLLLAYLAAEFARGLRARPDAARVYSYIGAVALAVSAVLLRYFLTPWLGTGLTYTTLYGAVAMAVWMGGWGPGAVAATLGYLLAHLFVATPMGTFHFEGIRDLLALLMYALSCVLIIALGHNMRAARGRYRSAEERFRKSQEAAIQGFAILRAVRDASGAIVDFTVEYVNPIGAALARHSPEAVVRRRLTEVLPGIVKAGVFDSLCKVAESGAPREEEVLYEEDGIRGWFRNMIVKVEDGVAISYFDITRGKLMERELAQRAHQLERADSNKSRFLATLSHELRNPLAPLRNGLAILKRRLGGESAEMLAMMDRQLHQMVRLVDDLLDVSRIDRGKIDLRRERVAVDAVIGAAIETARPNIDARSHELVVRFAQKALHVEGDSVRLAQIVSNLLINAAKFTPAKGRIELGMRAVDAHVEISVRDNGVGIEPDHLPRVFEMFVQLDRERGSAGGLGLGLALVKSLVDLHDGRVEARSDGAGKGTEFVVLLPLAEQAADLPAPRTPVGIVQKALRVLVVDDNEDAARTLGELLAAQGHEVTVHLNGVDGFAAAEANPPDVAFLDLNMPGLDGFELAKRLRATAWGASMRIIAVTGMGRASDLERTREVGFDAHLTKPADPERILELAVAVREESNTVVPFTRTRPGG